MNILMDADCLIKITKANIKEYICQHDEIFIPEIVKKEVVDAGKREGCPDADLVEENIRANVMSIAKESSGHIKGDQALIEIFRKGQYDAVATDDAKVTQRLRLIGIPFVLPSLLIYSLYKRKVIDPVTALSWLDRLLAFISEDEYNMVKVLLEEKS